MAAAMKAMKAMKAKTVMKKTMKAKKAKTAMKAMKAKDKGMRASFRKTKFWSATWMGLYYKWELVGLKWNNGHVLETWNATLRPGWSKSDKKALEAMDKKAMKAAKATKAKK
jgi:hypothetical protein